MLDSSGENHAALRGPGDRRPDHSVLHHPCLEPQTQQLDHPPVRHPLSDQTQQLLLVKLAEEVANVGLCDPHPASRERDPDALQCLQRRPAGTKAIRDLQEVGLEDRLKHQPCRLLTDPVTDRRDPERPLATIGLRDRHAPDRRGTIRTLSQSTLQLAEHPLDPVLLDLSQRHSIDAGRATIRPHPPPRLPEDVTPPDPVKQSVKTAFRGPLGTCP
jgi:hypothetical protein